MRQDTWLQMILGEASGVPFTLTSRMGERL